MDILLAITTAYCSYTGKLLTFFFKEEIALVLFTTTKNDKKKG